MSPPTRRSAPADQDQGALTSITTDALTVPEAWDRSRVERVLDGLRSGRRPVDSCPCGHDRDQDCARHISDHGAAYRARVDLQRQADGRRCA